MFEYLGRKRHSLVFRLLLYFLLSVLALSVALAISFRQSARPHLVEQVLPNVARYLDYMVEDIGVPPDLEVARRLADEMPFEIRIQGQGIDWASSPSIGSIADYRLKPAPAPYENIMFEHQRNRNLLLLQYSDVQYLFVIEDPYRRGAERRHWLLFTSLGLVLVLLYAGIRRMFRPIAVISEQVKKIGEGDLQQSITADGKGELGMLAQGINRMSEQIRSMLESKSGLLLAISHELRSPLTRMRVNLELLDDSELRQKLIEDCREMEALLGAILESEKLSSGHAPLALRRCDLAGLAEEVVCGHPERGRIVTRLAPVEIDVDALRFKLLIKNLLDNACEYSAGTQAPVDISLRPESGRAILEVVDRGTGIAADQIPRLTEAFYRPDEARQRKTGGYGLGLYLCRLIVAAHGGELRIESEPGEGTRVTVELPFDNS